VLIKVHNRKLYITLVPALIMSFAPSAKTSTAGDAMMLNAKLERFALQVQVGLVAFAYECQS
jgi:hypothetical protein